MSENRSLSDTDLKALVVREIALAESARSPASDKLTKALEYYQGEMKDVPAELGRSKAVSRDTADVVGWVLPGIIRVFTASDHMAVAEPVGPEDEQMADQVTDGINYVFWKDNDGYRNVYNATWDSLMGGDGILKTYHEEEEKTERSRHSGLSDDQLGLLLSDEDGEVEVINYSGPLEPESPSLDGLHSVVIERKSKYGCTKCIVVAPENYGKDGDSTECDEARFQYHKEEKTRSDLIEMGFDRDKVEALGKANRDTSEEIARDQRGSEDNPDASMELIDLYECYVRVDTDGDGIAELLRVYFAGNKGGGEILEVEEWDDEQPFDSIPCQPMPHRFESGSLADETMDVQRIKTAMLRAALDNTYATNNPQRFAIGNITNPDELFSPSFGGVVFGKDGAQIEQLTVPFVAGHAYDALNYMDQVIERRTGVSRMTMALDPDALQNQTATANQNAKDAAYSQIELIARNQAELGWKKVFRKILKLEVKHQNKARTIRMRGKFVEIDPRHWNADMDVSINVGLGTGSRDRDMAVLQQVLTNQTMLAQQLGAVSPAEGLKMLPFIMTTLRKQAESAGIKSPELFFPEYTQETVEQMSQAMAEQAQQPDPKAQAEMQKIELKAQTDGAALQQKAANDAGNLAVKAQSAQSDIMLKSQIAQVELAQSAQQFQQELASKERQAMIAGISKVKSAVSGTQVGGRPG